MLCHLLWPRPKHSWNKERETRTGKASKQWPNVDHTPCFKHWILSFPNCLYYSIRVTMAVELPSKPSNTHLSMIGSPRGTHFASLHRHSKNGRCSCRIIPWWQSGGIIYSNSLDEHSNCTGGAILKYSKNPQRFLNLKVLICGALLHSKLLKIEKYNKLGIKVRSKKGSE